MNSVSTIVISGPFGNEIWLTSSPSEKQWRSLCFDSEYEFRINGSSHSLYDTYRCLPKRYIRNLYVKEGYRHIKEECLLRRTPYVRKVLVKEKDS